MDIGRGLKFLAVPVLTLLLLVGYSTSQAAGASLTDLANIASTSSSLPLQLIDSQGRYELGSHLDILEDPTGELTIEDVISPEYASQFIPSQEDVPNFGYTESAYWVRFTLDNQTSSTNEWLLEQGFANTHYIDLYTPGANSPGYVVKQSGNQRPISTRDVIYPNIVFNLTVPTHNQQINYVRIKSQASMTIDLRLWTKNAFISSSGRDLILHWLIYGGFIALLVYHLFLLVTLKDTIYLYFFIMATSMLAVLLAYTGYLGVYLLPSLYPYTTVLLPVFISIMYIFIILFSDTFLELKTRFPIFHWANIGFLVFWALLLLLVPFISYLNIARLMTPAQLVTIGITWLIGMTVFRSSTRPLRFFMLAWIGMAASLFLLVLVRLTIIPSNYFNENIFQLGFIVMAVSWSMALADRINLFKLQTDTANRNLKNSEHKLIQILEGIPLGVVVYGKDQKPTYMNQRSSEILSNPKTGKAPDLSAGRTITQAIEHFSFKAAGTGKTYPLEDIPVYQALQGKPAFVNDIEMDTGDARVPLEIWANPIMDEQGGVESAVAVFQDITEQRQLDVELAEYRRNLELLVKERTAELDEANEQLQLWVEWLLVANQVHQAIAGEVDLPQAFEKLAATILHLLGAIFVLIVRWDAQDEHYQIFCKSTFEQATGVEEIRPIFSRETPLRNQIDEGKIIPLSPEQAASLPAPLGICFQDSSVQSLVFVPLKVRQAPAGVLGIASIAANIQMGTLQMELLERIAFDLSSLVEDASMLDQKRTLVAMEERNRLARDLHDSVTQTLFTTTLLSEVMPQVWRRDPEQGLQMLEKLRRLTRGALAEMRTMLIELRPSAVLNTPLSELLLQLTEAITSRSGVPFQLFIEKIDILPDDVQMNFYRIAQEAFNNVIKHSQAMHVTASLSEVPVNDVAGSEAKQIRLVIQDDGVGFASGNETPGRLGMGIMRERAAAIQADLSIISEPGHGTQVTLAWIGKLEVRTQV